MKFSLRKAKKHIYLDHAAATPVDPRVFDAMKPWLTTKFANASALYKSGVEARRAVDTSRALIADYLHTQKDTVLFTSGATEANNLAIIGLLDSLENGGIGKHIVATAVEHSSVLEPLRILEKRGVDVTYLPVNKEGLVSASDVAAAIKENTVLVSIIYANNEIGSIQPIADIGREILKKRKARGSVFPYLHTDAAQAANYLSLDVEKLHVDLMTLNGAKIYGPKGVGVLYKRRGVELAPLLHGGWQEFGLRSGTENVAGIVGMGEALRISREIAESEEKRLRALQEFFLSKINIEIKNSELNGAAIGERRLCNNLNVYIPGIEGEQVVLYLDAKGVACSTGSACSEDGSVDSHVLMACGYKKERVQSSVRFSMGRSTTHKDIDHVIAALIQTRATLRP